MSSMSLLGMTALVVPCAMPRCSAPTTPACPEPAYCKGLCGAHYRRQVRGVPIDTPLQARDDLEEQVTIRLPAEVLQALDDEAEKTKTTRAEVHRGVLERWAKRRAK